MSAGAHRNEPCWCGSGKKFKKCHIERHKERALPPEAIIRQARSAGAWKTCLHPDASAETCGKVIGAHTLQKRRTLRHLIDSSNHVSTFYPYQPDAGGTMPKLQRRGWHQASTFEGFCSIHDDATFAAAEKSDTIITAPAVFALSYRALCHELYQKVWGQRTEAHERTLADRGLTPSAQRAMQRVYDVRAAGRNKAITQLWNLKARADRELLSGDYAGWHFAILRFDGPLCLATAGTTTPTWDLNGRPLQVLHDPEAELEHLYVSVVSGTEDDVAVVFGWRIEHAAPEALLESLLSRDPDDVGSWVAQYVFAHLENVYFAHSWWLTLTEVDQQHMRELAVNSNPYYEVPAYVPSRLVPWTFTGTVGILGRTA